MPTHRISLVVTLPVGNLLYYLLEAGLYSQPKPLLPSLTARFRFPPQATRDHKKAGRCYPHPIPGMALDHVEVNPANTNRHSNNPATAEILHNRRCPKIAATDASQISRLATHANDTIHQPYCPGMKSKKHLQTY